MSLSRYVGIVDLGVATVVLVTLLLPAREMYASAAHKADPAAQYQLAAAEARTMADPRDGQKVDDLFRKLSDAGFKDWALEAAVRGEQRSVSSPTHWRALLATSLAYVDRIDVKPALEFATRALTECQASRDTCPTWEQVRMELYHQHLDEGVKSGIDPRVDPKGFREASQGAIRTIRLRDRRSGNPAR
ncbi:MAG: hypothetical protein AB7P03_00245 [Kofleriaceae bacterium]